MNLWDKAARLTASPPQLDGRFSAWEAQRLIALRDRLARQPAHVDFELDERRLIFARWLVEHGRLSEFMSDQ
jgi:hypothetical protein